MLARLATAHGWSAGAGSFSLLPVVGSAVTLVLLRTALRTSIGVAAVAASLVLGTIFWLLADAWGITLALSTFVASAGVIAIVTRSGRRAPR